MGYTHGCRWNRQKVKDSVLEVVDFYKLKRMPSRNELKEYYKNGALTSRISKEPRGYYGIAEELGLPMKDSETNTGKQYEYKIKEILEQKSYKVEKMSQNFPYDLLVNDNVKIDVKVSRLYNAQQGYGFYSYNIERGFPKCDVYMLVAISETQETIFIIPSKEVSKNTQISIGKNDSKYNKYKDRYDYIDKYIKFYNELF